MQANAKARTMATGSDNSTLISPISHHITATGNRLIILGIKDMELSIIHFPLSISFSVTR